MNIKHIISTITCLVAFLANAGTLTIDGHLAVLDSVTNTYICPTTIVNFGQELEASIEFKDMGAAVTINGTAVTNGGYFTFDAIAGGKNWTVEAIDNGVAVTRQLTFTYLPIMLMNGDFNNEYKPGTVQVLDPDEYIDDVMLSQIKWRGATTNLDGKHKRNFHIKFVDENGEKKNYSFFGLRSDNSWLLDAGQADFLRIRNRVNTELWNDFASKPYYFDKEPKAKTGVDGKMIEMFHNGKYMGIYAFTEGMDRKTLKIKPYDPETGEIHGQLWKAVGLNGPTTFNIFSPYNNNLATWMGFETKYPELDEVAPTNYKALGDGVLLGDTSSIADFNRNAHKLFDIPVIMDYEIFLQVLLGVDNYAKNIYWLTYDTAESPMLTLAVWDLDNSMGGWWNPGEFHSTKMDPLRSFNPPNGVLVRMTRPAYIYNKLSIERYHELRKDVLSTDSLIARYTTAVNYIKNCGAVKREEQRWSKDSDLAGRELNIERELAYVTDWITKRMNWLDQSRYAIPIKGDVNRDKTVDITDINAVIDATLNGGFMSNASADVDGDGVVDVSDLNIIVDIILGFNN